MLFKGIGVRARIELLLLDGRIIRYVVRRVAAAVIEVRMVISHVKWLEVSEGNACEKMKAWATKGRVSSDPKAKLALSWLMVVLREHKRTQEAGIVE